MVSGAPRLIFAAGGTGGHLWPALSLALAIRKIEPGAEFLFVGTGRPIEEKIIDAAGIPRVVIKSSGYKGRNFSGKVRALTDCVGGLRESLKIMKAFRPNLCFGAGGYVSVPVGVAAWLRGVPLVIYDQNSRPGLSNRFLSRLARRIFLGFTEARRYFPADKVLVTGNPIRPEIGVLHDLRRSYRRTPLTIGVTGGSQGASAMNRAVVPALISLQEAGLPFAVVHQSGEADCDWVREQYLEAGVTAQVQPFFQDMAAYYTRTDLIIGRAGALTISEMTAARLPSVLVPLPTAADDHQTENARHLVDLGAALMLPEKDLTPESLAVLLQGLLENPARLDAMSQASAAAARLDVDQHMALICMGLIGLRPLGDSGLHSLSFGE